MDKLADHYRELDLAQGAGVQEIKASYRRLAKVWHPDRFTHDRELQAFANEKLAKINSSFAFLIKHSQSPPPSAAAFPPKQNSPTPPNQQPRKPPSGPFQEGLWLYSAGRIKDSLSSFRKAADLGDPYGHYAVGFMLSRHNGAIMPWQWGNYHRTILDCWLRAAEHGIMEAEFMAGTCYACGQGTKVNKDQANAWLQKAAAQGHSEAAKWL
ncbi:MAG: DnaJ domain-containing protein, partial [Verrucomicrobiota bacterium]